VSVLGSSLFDGLISSSSSKVRFIVLHGRFLIVGRGVCLFFVGHCFVAWLQLLAILPLACVHTLGNLFTNMSLGKVAVSFTHTIKAMEPFFSVLLSAAFLGEVSLYLRAKLIFSWSGGTDERRWFFGMVG